MKLERERFRLELSPGEVLRLETAGAFEVAVEEGRVWLTRENDGRDVWLLAGQCARFGGHGLAVLEAVQRARIRVGVPGLLL